MRYLPPRTHSVVFGLALVLCGFLAANESLAQSATVLIFKGDSLLQLEKPQRAIDLFDQAIKKEPVADSYLARARAWYMMDRMDRFLLDVEQALKQDSTSANAQYQRAVYSMRADDPRSTEYHASKTIELATNPLLKAQGHVIRGEARAQLKRIPDAIQDLEKGIEGTPTDTDILKLIGRLYDQVGRYEDALRILEQLCTIEPGEVGHWSNRGFELTRLERYAEALPMIERALAIDKDEPVALSNRAYVYLVTDREKEAWTDVERSLRSYPSNPFALRTRAMLHIRKGDRAKACEDLILAKAIGGVPEVERLVKENCDTATPPRKK